MAMCPKFCFAAKWRTVCKESITVISLYFRGFNQDIL